MFSCGKKGLRRGVEIKMKLVILNGPAKGQTFKLKEAVVLSRQAGKGEIPISDQLASSPHAKVIAKKGLFYLKDMDSKNGTYVEGKINDYFPLRTGLKFQIGSTWLEVRKIKSPPHWRRAVVKELNTCLPQIKDKLQEIRPFKKAVLLNFASGIQKSQTWTLCYGPRVAGRESLDLPLLDPLSPPVCFLLYPDKEGHLLFKTPCPEEVSLNGESQSEKKLQNQDQISFGGTCIKIHC